MHTEVQEDVYTEVLQPWMRSHGYSSLYNPRPPAAGSTTGGPMDGVSLHYKNALFRWVGSVWGYCVVVVKQLATAACVPGLRQAAALVRAVHLVLTASLSAADTLPASLLVSAAFHTTVQQLAGQPADPFCRPRTAAAAQHLLQPTPHSATAGSTQADWGQATPTAAATATAAAVTTTTAAAAAL